MNKILNELNNLQFNSLDDDWVQGIYYSEFLEFGELSPEYETAIESINIRSVIKETMLSIDEWLNMEETEEEKSWASLSNHINHQKLLAMIAFYIDHGSKNVVTKEYRNIALLASRLYYKLLSISGYKAYHIYHSQLFAHSLGCLGFPKAMCDNEDNYFNSKELTREVNSVIRELKNFVLDLRSIIEKLQLTSKDMNFEDILSNLVDVTGGAIVNKLNVDKIELGNISRVIYEIIDILICDAKGEPNKEAIKLLFKCILPKLVSASVDCRNANNLVRASYVTYSGLLLSKYGKAALSGYSILLQHLCYTLDGLERAEVRSARVSLVVGLMSLLPRKTYRTTVKWLLKLSATSKISHRQIALEMLSNLLSNEPEEKKPEVVASEQSNPNENQDASNPEEFQQPSTSDSGVGDSITTSDITTDELQPTAMSTDDDDSQLSSLPPNNDDQEVTDDDIAGLLRQRPHTVPHAEILRAVYDRVNDVSSTLRTRALAILTDCVASKRPPMKEALLELNGDGEVSRLMAVCARCVCDERAAVRRSSVALLHRLLLCSAGDNADLSTSPSPNDLGILVGLCRDASILVRSAAIGALGEILITLPCDAVFDAFLSGPMHQLSDPENKVQEQVVSLVQQVLVDRLGKHDAVAVEDTLPWKFLAAITRHNMRRHLQKACTLLNKSANCINHRLVDIISTHLSAVSDERDLQCLVMLTSVAKHLEYSDVSFVLDYYYRLTESSQNRDVRLMPLTLELLTMWSRFTTLDARSALRDHLVKRLASSADDGCRIACASLAAQLDPSNLQWATELMQLSERRALDGGELEEWMRAADLSLVAPTPPSPGLLKLFLSALVNPPPEWCDSRRGACVAGAGRLCVRSRAAAADAAPSLAALLHQHAAPLPARLNALLALTDICTRYTCIVEPLLGSVCGCLSSQAAAPLRRGAARALTRLLLAGYLRLRPPLFYRYCALLADEDHDVREPAEYYVTCCMTTDTIYHHFVDCIIHYNKEESEGISFDARQLIYDVMLQRLSLVQKLNVQCRLAREVLGHAADLCDDEEELPPSLNAALLDTITLLCGPRMKLPKKPQTSGDADIDDLQERVTTNIVSHKMKRTVAEVLVPAVLRLYARLRSGGGQIAAYLVRIATDLLNDYRHEIEELIDNDEELVERVQQFQETIGLEPSFGNARNLVTSSAPPEPDTPRAPRKRPSRAPRETPRKRALRI